MAADMITTHPFIWIYTVVMLAFSGAIAAYAAERGKNKAMMEDGRRLAELKLEFDQRLSEHKAELDLKLERTKRVSDIHVKKDYEFMENVYSAILQAKYAFMQLHPLDAPMDDVEFMCHIRGVKLRDRNDPLADEPYPPTDSCKAEREKALELATEANAPYIESVMARRPFIPPHIFDEIVSFWKMGADTALSIRYPGFNPQIASPEQFDEKFSKISMLISEHFGITRP